MYMAKSVKGMNNKQMRQRFMGKGAGSPTGTKVWTDKEDAAEDKKMGIKPGSKKDLLLDKKRGVGTKPISKLKKKMPVKKAAMMA